MGISNMWEIACKNNNDINKWNSIDVSSADTFIEWCFEQKCKTINNGVDIITEWRMRKRQYISYLETTAFDFQHFSRHDGSHSVFILEAIEMLLGRCRVKLLSAGDLWMLLECAYMHDMGMTISHEELIQYWEEDEEFHEYISDTLNGEDHDLRKAALYYAQIDDLLRDGEKLKNVSNLQELEQIFPKSWPVEFSRSIALLITDYIRPRHANRVKESHSKIEKNGDSVIPDRLFSAMVEACCLHGEDFESILKKLDYECKGFGPDWIHPRFAAAMLRMGDMLDLDNNRFNPRMIEHFGHLPYVSMIHLKKHQAITHFTIKESGVEVEAASDNVNTCMVLSGWFYWLKEETKDLSCNWNQIVPDVLKGSRLNPCKTKIYYVTGDGTKTDFTSKPEREFEVNKKKLVQMLIGANIYTNSMDFIREYLQNAMDATKMQLWQDLKNDVHYYSGGIRPNMILKEITPFDISTEIFERYEIKIKITIDMKKQEAILSFTDIGIGMERDCIDALSRIGSGWRMRSKYRYEIQKMPEWLRPTGGFGIGIQSAFMATDKVKIITRDEENAKGKMLTLTSPYARGSVLEEGEIDCERGTTVEVPLKIRDLFKNNRKYAELEEQQKNIYHYGNTWGKRLCVTEPKKDMFSESYLSEYVVEFLEKYITTLLPNSLFPIRLIYDNNNSRGDKLLRNKYLPFAYFGETGE